MAEWHDYTTRVPEAPLHPIVGGRLLVLHACYSPQLENSREIYVHLPSSYDHEQRHYPVIYMHDGQNLFDPHTSFAGEWGVDDALAIQGLEAIVVGIPHISHRRLDEYSPFPDDRLGGGHGVAYLDFLIDTLKPLIDADFRTRPERAATGMIGASMGALISLYAFFERSETFGFVGAMSPSLWFGHGTMLHLIEAAPFVPGRLVVDVGTNESAVMLRDARRLRHVLQTKGYRQNHELRYLEDHGAAHTESAWSNRLGDVLRFLLLGTASAAQPVAAD